MRSDLPFINVYKKANLKSKVVTQLLYGDQFKVIKKGKSWFKIKNDLDNYKGFIKNRFFPSSQKNTHKIYKLNASLYFKPDLNKFPCIQLAKDALSKDMVGYFPGQVDPRLAALVGMKDTGGVMGSNILKQLGISNPYLYHNRFY